MVNKMATGSGGAKMDNHFKQALLTRPNKSVIGSATTIMVNSGMKEHMRMARKLVNGRPMISLAR